jgi:hypothetical protein
MLLTQASLHPPAAAEERVASRHRPRRLASVRLFVKPAYRSQPADLRDLSRTGAGLIVDAAVDVDALIFVQLPGRRSGVTCTRAARVVHRSRLTSGEWLLGCRWQHELPEEEVKKAVRSFD